MTWIEVASDAVKIGLGATIAIAGAVLNTYLSNKNKKVEAFSERKRNLLENIMPIYESLSIDALEESVAAMGAFEAGENESTEEIAVDEGVYDIAERNDHVVALKRKFNELEAKVSLLGLSDLSSMIDEQRSIFYTLCTSEKNTWVEVQRSILDLERIRINILSEFAKAYEDA